MDKSSVWVAVETFLYEGANVIGVYSDESKAMQACQDEFEKPLVWKNGEAQGNNIHHIFEVGRYEIDK